MFENDPPCFREHPWTKVHFSCPEFRLLEHLKDGLGPFPQPAFTVQPNEEISKVWEREKFKLSNDKENSTREERLNLIGILQSAESAAKFSQGNSPNSLMAKMITTDFGKRFVELIGVRMADATGKKQTYGDALEQLGEDFRTAFRALGRGTETFHTRQGPKYPIRLQMLRVASEIVKTKRERPTKKEIQTILEKMGYGFRGKNAPSTWRGHFSAVELHNLE